MRSAKFGTFAGVFTPSILTILGVIMYLRLGWVVGQAGIISAIGIIIVAHIISVTTGLSISSISTDKRIKTGGIYYMLSRSLGLPIGGSIGITIFVGTALSISLYVIGFCENFMALTAVREFFGLEDTINAYRILGTAVVLILVIIAFISTSVAIKTQFFILGAILLSLVSIFIGFFTHTDLQPDQMLVGRAPGGFSLEALFAIFFPAATGFTAGVAMSGDLKNPKKSIPYGTLISIGTGLLVYLILAICFSLFVKRDLLLSDYNFLIQIAWFPPLVMAGIWGATLSSALGGILGAPRILQAISLDRITPMIFGKGIGRNNEPRNALLITFLIAEIGILIGELNLIARLVSMFYIAAYGFINLSFALEKWASTDFRPSFMISRWNGIIGFVACFIVMLRLDLMAMFTALIILGLLYFYIKQKSLRYDFGDVWQSVWSSIIRSALKKMDKKILAEKNWHPNIILFSGGTKARPYLVELGKCMVGKQGFLSNFDLIENKSSKVVITKTSQSNFRDEMDTYEGVFARRQEVRDIYEGIENIASNYGFSGVEPNTIMLGWSANSKDPIKLVQLIKRLTELDFNLLLVNYDKDRKFGKYELIDIWVRGGGNNGSFLLSLIKFIWLSHEWRYSKLRVLTVNPVNNERDDLYKSLSDFLDEYRIHAEIRIINNEIEQKPVYEIIQTESGHADLVFLGLPELAAGKENEFIENTNRLCDNLGSLAMVKASSFFKELQVIKSSALKQVNTPALLFADYRFQAQHEPGKRVFLAHAGADPLKLPEDPILKTDVEALYKALLALTEAIMKDHVYNLINPQLELMSAIGESIFGVVDTLKIKLENNLLSNVQLAVIRYHRNILGNLARLMNNEAARQNQKRDNAESLIASFKEEAEQLINALPEKITLEPEDEASKSKIIINLKRDTGEYLYSELIGILMELMNEIGILWFQGEVKLQNLSRLVNNRFIAIESIAASGDIAPELIQREENTIKNFYQQTEDYMQAMPDLIKKQMINKMVLLINNYTQKMMRFLSKKDRKLYHPAHIDETEKKLQNIPYLWSRNTELMSHAAYLEIILLSYKVKIRELINELTSSLQKEIKRDYLDITEELLSYLKTYKVDFSGDINQKFDLEKFQFNTSPLQFFIKSASDKFYNEVKLATRVIPEKIELIDKEDYNVFEKNQFEQVNKNTISAFNLVDYVIQNELIDPLFESLATLPDELNDHMMSCREATRAIAYNLVENLDTSLINPDTYKTEILLLIDRSLSKTEGSLNAMKETAKNLNNSLSVLMNSLENKLSFATFLSEAIGSSSYFRKYEKTRTQKKYHKPLIQVRTYVSRILCQLWFWRVNQYNLANKVRINRKPGSTTVVEVRDFIDQVSPNLNLLNQLPFYYKQLFLRKQYYLNEYWVNRAKELYGFQNTITRYKQGIKGAILVSGEYNSGKTFLVNFALRQFMPGQKIWAVTPPLAGSIQPSDLAHAFQAATEKSGSISKILNELPMHSLILLDNTELWWENSDNGDQVLKTILKILEDHSHHHIFILTINTWAYRVIKGKFRLDDQLIGHVELESIQAEDLQQAILTRQNASHIKLILGKRIGSEIRSWQFARLFSRLRIISGGNPGIAMNVWLSQIAGIENESIEIRYPVVVYPDLLSGLPEAWNALLIQLIIHKRLTVPKLIRIFHQKETKIRSRVKVLLRAGLVDEVDHGIYEIDRTAFPYLMAVYTKMNVI